MTARDKGRALRAACGAGAFLGLGILFFGGFRLMAGDGAVGLSCILVGWLLKDAAVQALDRARLREALSGLAVRDAMITGVATIPAHVGLAELAAGGFLRGGYHSYPVVRAESVVGLLSVRGVVALPPEERERTSVQAVMTPIGEGIVVDPGAPLLGALARLGRSGVGRLLVVEGGHLEGLLSKSSVMRHLRLRAALSA